MYPEPIMAEIHILRDKLAAWVLTVPEHRLGRRHRLNFSAPGIQRAYTEIIANSIISCEMKYGIRWAGTIVASAVYTILQHHMYAGDTDAIELHKGRVDVFRDGIPWKEDPAVMSLISGLSDSRSRTELAQKVLGGGFLSAITGALNKRIDDHTWQIPDFTRLEKQIGRSNAKPSVFIMRRPDFKASINAEPVGPMHEMITLLLKFQLLNVWTTMKELIEHLGGHVIVAGEPARGRQVFVRDTAVLLPNGKLYISDFKHGNDTSITNAERDVVLDEIRKVTEISGEVKVADKMDGGNVIVLDRYRSRPVVLVGGYDREAFFSNIIDLGLQDVVFFPIPISDRYGERYYHTDFVAGQTADKSLLMYPQFMFIPSIANDLRGAIGAENFILADRETAENYGLNFVCVGHNMLMPHCSADIRRQLESRDNRVITPEDLGLPKGSLYYGAGSYRCFTFELPFDCLKEAVQKDICSRRLG